MKIKLAALAVISAATFNLGACSQDATVLNNPPGTYEKTTSSTDANGTNVKRDSSTEITVDGDGNKEAVIKSKTTTDPKGLFNKTTNSQTKQVIENRY